MPELEDLLGATLSIADGSLDVTAAVTAHAGDLNNPHAVTAAQAGAIATGARGAADGVASLDGTTKVPIAELPDTPASKISDSTAAGRALLTATDVDAQRAILVPSDRRIWECTSPHSLVSNISTTSGRVYAIHCGFLPKGTTINYVNFRLRAAGVGTQTAEVGVYSTPLPPNMGFGQTLTRLIATGSLDDLTAGATSNKRNSSALGLVLSEDTHVWAALRVVMGTQQLSVNGFSTGGDNIQTGAIVRGSTDTLGALTSLDSFTTFNGHTAAIAQLWLSED